MDGLCHGCLSKIGPGEPPLCEDCYSDLQAMPSVARMARVAEIIQNERMAQLSNSLVSAANAMTELLEASKRLGVPHWTN